MNTTDDPNAAIRGVLWEARREYLILKGAELLTVGQKATPMDGEILIYREKVAWIQVLGGERE